MIPIRSARSGLACLLVALTIAAVSARGQSATNASEPRLPGAVLDPPAWLVKDAPFDMVKFFALPRPEENAAPLHLDALFEFGPEVAPCFSGDVRARTEVARARAGRLRPIWDAWNKDPSSVDRVKIDEVLRDYPEGLHKLDLAQKRPRCVFAIGITLDTLLPHAQVARYVAMVLALQADRDLDRDDFDHAVGCVDRLFRLSRDLRPRGPMISQLVSIAIERVASHTMISRFLIHPDLRPVDCERLIALLDRHEAEAIDPYATGVMCEYIIQREQARMFEEKLRFRVGSDGRPFDETLDNADLTQFLREQIGDGADKGPKRDGFLAKMADGWVLAYFGLGAPENRIAFADIARTLLAEAGKIEPEQRRAVAAVEAKYLKKGPPDSRTLVRLLCPAYGAFTTGCAREAFYLRSARCLLALRRWQVTHREPPPSLEAACKDAGMQGVPIDSFSGKPLKLATIEGDLVVYSIGPDGVDDRALKDSDLAQKPLGDLLAPMPKVQAARR